MKNMNDPGRKPEQDDGPGGSDSLFSPRAIMIFIFVILGVLITVEFLRSPKGESIPYSELKQKIKKEQIASVELTDKLVLAKGKEKENGETKKWQAVRVDQDKELIPFLEKHGVEFEARYQTGCEGSKFWIWVAPLLILLLLWTFFLRRMRGPGGGMGGPGSPAMNFGKSKAEMYVEEGTGVTFEDVAGCEESKQELREIVQFLQEPEKFTRLGGTVPKGVVLVGPPGTGKTLLARAVAGEADVPFFSLSGSDFVEMFVGVGAARVRDLFEQSKKHAPCIVFVDELDAIGKKRGAGGLQGNDEREQTLNALLVEMDGFDPHSGVIILAATNRPEMLDPALLRPGRFDRQVAVDRPDIRGRQKILDIHSRSIVMGDDVDLKVIAGQTPGFVGADLANTVNEAALLAARADKDAVEMEDFQEAIERVMAGLEKKNRHLNKKEKNIVAYHESGHAIVGAALEHADPVHKVSIVSRGMGALGYTLQVPLEDRYLMTRNEIEDKICMMLGGRAAEAIIFEDISTGAADDLKKITELAKNMVKEYGMSEVVGNIRYSEDNNEASGLGLKDRDYSEETAEQIDREVHKIIEGLYERTEAILNKNLDVLHDMATFLKENEVLEGDQLGEFLDTVRQWNQADGDEAAGAVSEDEPDDKDDWGSVTEV